MFPEVVNTPDGKRRVLLVSCYPSHFCTVQLNSLMEEVLCSLCALFCGGSGRNKKGGAVWCCGENAASPLHRVPVKNTWETVHLALTLFTRAVGIIQMV